ncbi:MAG TPA: NHL repeat-containing protein [Edaphobacter sp.]|nr:NHL repeat-containing protein [Edaphobacter sp.]
MRRLPPSFALLALVLLTGCGPTSSQKAAPVSVPGQAIEGTLHGGNQPVVGAHIYLFAANNIGYRAPSISLINPHAPGAATDANGTYLITNASGGFSLNGAYSCIPGQQLYILATTGNPGLHGSSNNDALAMLTALGSCPSDGNLAATVPYISINELTTVATIYALAGFMSDPIHVSSALSPGSIQGLANAFATVNTLVDIASGTSLAQNQQGNGVLPQAKLNTLANILVPCINSTSQTNGCTTLFNSAKDSNGNAPLDTATAVLNIAHNPAANPAALFTLATANAPYQPALTAAPNDWTLAITFYAPNMAGPYYPAFDSAGNLWVPAFASNTLTEFDPSGNILSGPSGFTGGGLNQPYSIAIDASDNPWVVNFGPINASTVSKFLSNGSPATATPYPCSTTCFFPAFGTTGNLWISAANRTTVLSPSGANLAQFTTSAYNSGIVLDPSDHAWTLGLGSKLYRLTLPSAISVSSESVTAPSATTELIPTAIDASGNIWFVSSKNSAIGKSDPTGKPLSPAGGYTGGGLNGPGGIAIDGANNVWITNRNTNSISAFTNAGVAITPSTGYTADGVSGPRGIAIDPSGNLWVTNFTYNSVTEFLGLAAPTATPITASTHGQRP